MIIAPPSFEMAGDWKFCPKGEGAGVNKLGDLGGTFADLGVRPETQLESKNRLK